MKILVAGGSGFLGSHLCDKLIEENNEILCLDNFSTGDKENISHLISKNNFKFIEHDIVKPLDIDNLDCIFNLACPASPPQYQISPIETIKTNVIGSLNLLNLAKKNNSKIFQASTSEIYGDPLTHPQDENYLGNVNPIGPRSCYDEGKRCAESLFYDFHRTYQLKIKIARIFNTYGKRMRSDDGRVVSNFICQALRNENITINGSGLQTRSFCYVEDLIEGILLFMNTADSIVGPVNLGNPSEISMLDLANIIIELTNSKSKIEFRELPIDDPKKRKPDISLAKQILNDWEPSIDIKNGLIQTIEYFKKKIIVKKQ